MLGMKPFGALGAGGRGGGGLGRRAALYLDFVNGMYTVNRQRRALADIMTIAGGVNGTRVNSAGLIEAATCPRFDYDPVTLAARGVLIEEQRTNLLTYSADFASGDWFKNNITAGASIVSPTGATDAALMQEDTNTGYHSSYYVPSLGTVTGTYSLTGFLKPGGRDWMMLGMAGFPSVTYFDSDAVAVGNVAPGATASISDFGGGWRRAAVSQSLTAVALTYEMILAQANGGTTYTGDGTSGGYPYGRQLELGAFPTSYIPTGATAVTRTPDSLTMTGTDFSSWWNQAEGTIVVKFDCFATDADDNFMFSATDASEVEQIRLLVYAGVVYVQVNVAGVNVVNMNLGAIDTGPHTLAVAYKANDFAACLDGGAVSTDTSGAVPTVDRAGFGRYAASNNGHLNGHLQEFAYEPRRLSNTMLQALS